jgi:thioredoxin:protein disulfide reductase
VWFFLLWLWLLAGLLYFIGGVLGNQDPLHPLTSSQQQALKFIPIHNLAELQQALNKAHGKIVMVDFYADWCVSCKIIEQNVFNQAGLKNTLNDVVLLQANISANNAEDKALQNYLHVYAPPTIIFFDRNGNEITTARMVGEISKQHFIQTIKPIINQ